MGDMFHTSSSQNLTNQQIGISTRDVGGSVVTGAAKSITGSTVIGGGENAKVNLNVQSLDPTALQLVSDTINQALAANQSTNQNALTAYQGALAAVAENQQSSQQAAASGNNPQQANGQTGLNPSQILWIAIIVVGGLLVAAVVKAKHH